MSKPEALFQVLYKHYFIKCPNNPMNDPLLCEKKEQHAEVKTLAQAHMARRCGVWICFMQTFLERKSYFQTHTSLDIQMRNKAQNPKDSRSYLNSS